MTCDDCLTALGSAELGPVFWRPDGTTPDPERHATLEAHLAGCSTCAEVASLYRSAESTLATALESSLPGQTPEVVADRAYRKLRSRRLTLMAGVPTVAAVLLAVTLFIGRDVIPEVQRLIAPPPAVETEIFSLQCLSPEQAASLLRPYLPTPQNPRWQAELFDVRPIDGGIRAVAVRAPRATLDGVPRILARFEADPAAACRTSAP